MRRILSIMLMLALFVPVAPSTAPGAENTLVIDTAYEENELKTFWEPFKKDLPDLAASASYIRGSTGPTAARTIDFVTAAVDKDRLVKKWLEK